MQFDQLKCLIAVAETKSFSKAAQELFMSQQAVSMNIKRLEEELTCELFYRTKSGVQITANGEIALEYAYHIFEEKDILAEKIEKNKKIQMEENKEISLLSVSSTSPVLSSLVPEIVNRIERKGNLKAELKFYSEEKLDNVLEQVEHTDVFMGLTTFRETEFYSKFEDYQDHLQFRVLSRDKIVAVINRAQYNEEQNLSAEELFQMQPCTSYNIATIDRYIDAAEVFFASTSNDIEFHRNMIKEMNAVVLMPELAYQKFFSPKRYATLPLNDIDAISLLHVAIFRKEYEAGINAFLNMFQKELYFK